MYFGRNELTGERKALKVLKSALHRDRTAHELTILSRLQHPNIIPAPIETSIERQTCLVWPLYPSDLHARVEKALLSEANTRSVMRQLLSALAYMHYCGFSHNDVKLENILVEHKAGDGEIKVVLGDFGLAQPSLRGGSRPVGTKDFMSPEMQASAGYDAAAADVFAAGVCCIMCLTSYGVCWSDRRVDFVSPTSLSPVGYDFMRAVLAFDPQNRPTAAALLRHPWLAEPCEAPASRSLTSQLATSVDTVSRSFSLCCSPVVTSSSDDASDECSVSQLEDFQSDDVNARQCCGDGAGREKSETVFRIGIDLTSGDVSRT